MSLQSARFRGDPRLAAIEAGDEAQFMRFGDSGPAVTALQCALIDHNFAIPDGPTGFYGQQTADAVAAFKTAMGFDQTDPVAGVRTISALDGIFALPYADRREWTESFGRASEGAATAIDPRPLQEFNFSRFEEQTRRLDGTPFTFATDGVQPPPAFAAAFVVGLSGLLDPAGSPNGPLTDSATWGASPFDLYHVHLVIEPGDATPAWDALAQEFQSALFRAEATLRDEVTTASGAEPESPEWTEALRVRLLEPLAGDGLTLAQRAEAWLQRLHAQSLASGASLRFLWHTFESLSGRWRPDGMQRTDPRRSWWNVIAPVPGPVVQTPFTAGLGGAGPWVNLGTLAFLVDDSATITVMAPKVDEAAALRGVPMRTIVQLDPAPHVPILGNAGGGRPEE